MNIEYIKSLIQPYVKNNTLTYTDFDKIFDILSLREQYQVAELLNQIGIDLVDEYLDCKPGSNDLDTVLINDLDTETDDVGTDDGHEYLVQYKDIRQSNNLLCALIKRGNKQAENDLCVKNSRLVYKYAHIYYHSLGNDLDMDDLMQFGYIGLIKAAEKFDPDKDYQFATYAVWWIKQSILRGLTDTGFTIRLPVHVVENLKILIRLQSKFEEEGFDLDEIISRIAIERTWTEDKVMELMIVRDCYIAAASLNTLVGEEGGTELGEFCEDKNTPQPEEEYESLNLHENIIDALNSLKPREREVLELRSGLKDGICHTLEDIGLKYGVTRERVRQIEQKALRRLSKMARVKKLKDFL